MTRHPGPHRLLPRHVIAGLTLTVLFVLLSGCQAGGEPTPGPVTITMMSGSVGKEFQVLQDQVDVFEARHPGIQVDLVELPESSTDRHAAYVEQLERGDPTIDLYMIDVVWPPEFGEKGWTLPLDDYVDSYGLDMAEFLPGVVQANTWQGKLVSMPWFTDAGLLYYRRDLLEEYGLAVPTTWAELIETARVIMAGEQQDNPELAGFVYQARQYEGLVCNYLEYVWSNGADVLSPGGDRVLLDSPQAVEALEILVAMAEIAPPGITSFAEEDALNYFQSGNAVFLRTWPYAWAVLNGETPVQGRVGIAPLPRGPRGSEGASTLGGWQLGISAFSQHPDEAFEFVAFLTGLEQQAYKAIQAGQNPTRLTAYSDEAVLQANPHMADLFDVFVDARPRPVHPRYPEISTIIQVHVYRALTGELDAAAATESMAREIRAIVEPGRDG